MHTFYEFFAGGGMARAGLGSDWQCLFANDISATKGNSYSANWGSDHLAVKDIYDVQARELPGSATMAWGSFPCQDLSLAGDGAGLEGERSGAFWGFWKLMCDLHAEGRKPKMVVLENVFGALTSRDGKDFELIAEAIASQGFLVGAMLIDAIHFLPQSRPRLFIVGVDASLKLPESSHTNTPNPAWHPAAMVRAHNRLTGQAKAAWRWWSVPQQDKPLLTLDRLIEADPQSVKWHSEEETRQLIEMMAPLHRRKVLAAQASKSLRVGTIYKRTRSGVQRAEVRFDGIAGCLRTPGGGSSRQTIMVVHGPNIKSRLISTREAARLMGLPDHYKLPEKYNEAYHLLGDGVVVPVVEHLSHHLLLPIVKLNQPVSHQRNRPSRAA
ncbi:DNA cytosine methyltransferase [Limnohabitans sp. Jir72]|uniref:DNA cytosine methyltransferase n=1 Tax=Limnohabitans sp. Jir72 TaxID=1977909 RepID=UPI000D3750B6|nr:DNA cytosine methyltransferase [Limnohabitans sp. Jir72]PUE26468.1 DNA (cytosine-5-)-methyltransferase [Limnohabitans sp. Jir72]